LSATISDSSGSDSNERLAECKINEWFKASSYKEKELEEED
jgi:hypothetical protein